MQSVVGVAMVPEAILEKLERMSLGVCQEIGRAVSRILQGDFQIRMRYHL